MAKPAEHQLIMPDIGLAAAAIRLSVWLKSVGQQVVEGERLVEVSAGEVTIDLPAPASGRLVRRLVEEDDLIQPGQILATIVEDD